MKSSLNALLQVFQFQDLSNRLSKDLFKGVGVHDKIRVCSIKIEEMGLLYETRETLG